MKNSKEKGVYSLEYNEKKQAWHHNYRNDGYPLNPDFVCVKELCTDKWFRDFKLFIYNSIEDRTAMVGDKRSVNYSESEIKKLVARYDN